MHVHLDPVGGVAGDMFAAALLDAFPERAEALVTEVAESRLHEIVTVRCEPFTDGVLRGRRFHTAPAPGVWQNRGPDRAPPQAPRPREHAGERVRGSVRDAVHGRGSDGPQASGRHHVHAEGHPHRRFADIREWIGESGLDRPVAERATTIFTLLAEAEGEVHGIPVGEVSFHEVGAWDSIADIICAAWLIDSLEPASWSSAPLPLGGGQVRTAHGMLPVPAPATALLLRGFPCHHDGVQGERVTPTGAAILRHLEPAFDLAGTQGRIARTGHGFGSRRLSGMSNVLRALVVDPVCGARTWREETIAVCSFEVDDQTAEDLAVGLDRLRTTDGVLDVVQTPVLGKKGRMAASVQVLARTGARAHVIERCFAETSTLGVRWQAVHRAALERREAVTDVAGEPIRIKRTRRPGGETTVKAEMDDLANTDADGGRPGREAMRRRAEST